MSFLGDIAESVVRGAVARAVGRLAAKGDITSAQATALVEGVMVELQLALEVYAASQKPATGGRTPT
jgi:hypothetical protein